MKRFLIYLLVMIGLGTGILFPENLTITKVGEWGSGYYYDVVVRDQYAYCAAGKGGLDIIDISNLSKLKIIGSHNTPDTANALWVAEQYAYIADWEGGLQIFDISDPTSPVLTGSYVPPGYVGNVYVKGNYAYVACYESGLHIVDISNPASPTLLSKYNTPGHARGVHVEGNYAYIADGDSGLQIIDVTTPSNPVLVGNLDTTGYSRRVHVSGNYTYLAANEGSLQIIDVTDPSAPVLVGKLNANAFSKTKDLFINGNYAFVAGDSDGLQVIDISKPTAPVLIGEYCTSGRALGIFSKGNVTYMADYDHGLQVFDISTPSSPSLTGTYNSTSGFPEGVYVSGNFAYIADYKGGLHIIDISDPTFPTRVGLYELFLPVRDVYIRDKYAYIATWNDALHIVDVSDPTNPTKVGHAPIVGLAHDVHVSGNYAYVGSAFGLSIIDVSDPSNPLLVGKHITAKTVPGVYARGNYLYAANGPDGLLIWDVSDPTTPVEIGNYGCVIYIEDVYLHGNYAYLACSDNGLHVIDISDPPSPQLLGKYETSMVALGVYVLDDYAYVADWNGGLKVVDVSNPLNLRLVGRYNSTGTSQRVFVKGNYAYLADGDSGKLIILYLDWSSTSPRVHLNRSRLNFAVDNAEAATVAQSVSISNRGGGSLAWTASTNQGWLSCTPFSGTNSGEISVSINSTGLSKGTYTGAVTFSAPGASNSPQTVEVILKVYQAGQTSVPFGLYTTPSNGATVSSSVPFTGWVLDDIGVQSVQLFREDGNSLLYVGDAVLVEGARPDVESAYPLYPYNYKAGWGYMMLTNFLPNGGNGTFKIHAIATDKEGNQVTLGIKTIICDNANAVKPFGTIDTPEQGGIVSGNAFVNFGWVLTPQPNTIPTDGSTITVWVDGVPVGYPVYNQYREDIATLFPGYANSNGAVGYFYLDTIGYQNGVHTIHWSVEDNTGNTDGIGSRYFTIQNIGSNRQNSADSGQRSGGGGQWPVAGQIPTDYSTPVNVKKGFKQDIEAKLIYPGDNGIAVVEIKELERVEFHLKSEGTSSGQTSGFLLVDDQLKALPIGSTMDSRRGVFYWAPGPGFIGSYRLVFLKRDRYGEITKTLIDVKIVSKF